MTRETDTAEAPAPTRPREIDELPAPPGLPILGNLLQVDRARIHQQVERWAKQYGPYFRFQLGNRRILAIADHAAMGTLLRDRPDGFRRTKKLAEISAEIGSAVGVFGAEGEAWKRQRRMVMAGFDPRHLRAYFPSLVAVSERLAGRWGRAADAGTTIELQADLMRYTVDTVAGLAFGAEVNTLESDADVIQQQLDKIFPAVFRRMFAAVPTWRWWKSAADRELDRSVASVGAAIQGFIAAARKRLEDPARRAAPKNLLEAMIVAADDPHSGITPSEVHGNVLTMLLAGEDTTANSLAWAIWLLFEHPECLARARSEIDERVGDPSSWTIDDFARLEYVEACINEAMRLRPVAPFIMLQALRETIVAGIRIPADTLIWGVMRSDSVREEFFVDAPSFRPDRWLGAEGAHGAASGSRCRSAPGRASAPAAIWRCSRSRSPWPSCSAGSTSRTSRRAAAASRWKSSRSRCRRSR